MTILIFLIVLAIAVFIILYRNNSNSNNVYKFINKKLVRYMTVMLLIHLKLLERKLKSLVKSIHQGSMRFR